MYIVFFLLVNQHRVYTEYFMKRAQTKTAAKKAAVSYFRKTNSYTGSGTTTGSISKVTIEVPFESSLSMDSSSPSTATARVPA
jgi:hypothetical protein